MADNKTVQLWVPVKFEGLNTLHPPYAQHADVPGYLESVFPRAIIPTTRDKTLPHVSTVADLDSDMYFGKAIVTHCKIWVVPAEESLVTNAVPVSAVSEHDQLLCALSPSLSSEQALDAVFNGFDAADPVSTAPLARRQIFKGALDWCVDRGVPIWKQLEIAGRLGIDDLISETI